MRILLLVILCTTIYAVPPEAVIYESWVHYEIDVKGETYPFNETVNKTYDGFKENYIALDNYTQTRAVDDYELALNSYSDVSPAEFKTSHHLTGVAAYGPARGLDTENLPDTKSWESLLPEVALKEAGPHSWAYAAVAAVEAFYNRKIVDPKDFIQLSVDQIITCVTNGKTPLDALQWIKTNGIDKKSDYTDCTTKTKDYKIPDIRIVQAEVDEIKAALQFTPVTVCFDISNLQQYKSGVVNKNCDESKLNYCGLLYAFEGDEWIIKTSLGDDWGFEGRIRIHSNAGCGVKKVAAFPMLLNEDIESFRDDFNAYKVKFQKTYATQDEEEYRFQIYAYALMDGGDLFGETQFTDWTITEFKAKYLLNQVTMKFDEYQQFNEIIADDDIDWRFKNIVSEVIDQEDCKSSWAIASKNALESYFRQQTSKDVKLSYQQLIDCSDTQQPKQGCKQGSTTKALDYIKTKGLIWESIYPNVGKDDQDCKTIQQQSLRPSNVVKLNNVNDIVTALNKRPVVVCFTASNLQNYAIGIVTQKDCGTDPNNYCGLLVGKTSQYWIIQGSFGTNWGLNGYVHIELGNNCGITTNAHAII